MASSQRVHTSTRKILNVFIFSIALCLLMHLPSTTCDVFKTDDIKTNRIESNDIDSFLNILDTPKAKNESADSTGNGINDETGSEIPDVAAMIPDMEASVGRLFKFALPTDIFPENCIEFQVSGVDIKPKKKKDYF